MDNLSWILQNFTDVRNNLCYIVSPSIPDDGNVSDVGDSETESDDDDDDVLYHLADFSDNRSDNDDSSDADSDDDDDNVWSSQYSGAGLRSLFCMMDR